MSISRSDSYAAAGVDVTAGYESVNLIKPMVESTNIPGVLGGLGGFGGMFEIPTGYKKPILVSGTDGVGTKLKIAFLMDKHDTVGIDCVAMCVNDIICGGAKPLFFLDYMAMGKNIPSRTAEIVSGIAEGCRQSGCALIGGETAEMPGFYPEDEYDLAGYSTGILDKDNMIDGSKLCEGDVLIGLASSGCHSNGFSLIRKALSIDEKTINTRIPELSCTIGEELIKPTRIYVKPILGLLDNGINIKAVSHITGGGLYENVPRMMTPGLSAVIDTAASPVPPIFELISKQGNIPLRDMYNTFNMGLGMVVAVDKNDVGKAMDMLVRCGQKVYIIGNVKKGEEGVIVK